MSRLAHLSWHCDDCRNGGTVVIELPIQVRRLHEELENAHAKTHPYTMCPSDYLEVRGVRQSEKKKGPKAMKKKKKSRKGY
jgi:hypothetical protein